MAHRAERMPDQEPEPKTSRSVERASNPKADSANDLGPLERQLDDALERNVSTNEHGMTAPALNRERARTSGEIEVDPTADIPDMSDEAEDWAESLEGLAERYAEEAERKAEKKAERKAKDETEKMDDMRSTADAMKGILESKGKLPRKEEEPMDIEVNVPSNAVEEIDRTHDMNVTRDDTDGSVSMGSLSEKAGTAGSFEYGMTPDERPDLEAAARAELAAQTPEAGTPEYVDPNEDATDRLETGLAAAGTGKKVDVSRLEPANLGARQRELIERLDILERQLEDQGVDVTAANATTWGRVKAWGRGLFSKKARETRKLYDARLTELHTVTDRIQAYREANPKALGDTAKDAQGAEQLDRIYGRRAMDRAARRASRRGGGMPGNFRI